MMSPEKKENNKTTATIIIAPTEGKVFTNYLPAFIDASSSPAGEVKVKTAENKAQFEKTMGENPGFDLLIFDVNGTENLDRIIKEVVSIKQQDGSDLSDDEIRKKYLLGITIIQQTEDSENFIGTYPEVQVIHIEQYEDISLIDKTINEKLFQK